MKKTTKTNAVRLLEQMKIIFNSYQYNKDDGKIDGRSVADKIGKSVDEVYKTLVASGNSHEIYIFVISVSKELDLKKAAKAASEKKIQMIAVKDILKYTGYIRGGCSPIGMKKHYRTFIDKDALNLELMIVSAGAIGEQIELKPTDLLEVIKGEFAELT